LPASPRRRHFLFNGDGRDYAGIVESIDRRTVAIVVREAYETRRELPWPVEIAAPLPKGIAVSFSWKN